MVAYPSKAYVLDVAKWLEKRKESGRRTVLFLGARAGGLFRSKLLYGTVQYFSPRTFNTMSRIEQFGECYRVLHQEDFSKSDIENILIASLQGLEPSEADISLSELVKAGIFDTIISTNIDDLLNRAFTKAGMKDAQDFQIFMPQQGFIEDILSLRQKLSCLLLQVFGDLVAREYSLIRKDFYLDTHEKLKTFLSSELQNDVLMLGYDPYWDRAIYPVFPQEGRELWYVNEGAVVESSLLPLLQKRMGKYIIGGEGNYERFMQALHWHFVREEPMNDPFLTRRPLEITTSLPLVLVKKQIENPAPHLSQPDATQKTPPVLSTYEKGQRRRVFIGYSQKDKRYFQQFQAHLARYEREKLMDVWDDTKIAPGTKWDEEIKKTLDITRVAILLISANFLASSFIAENILPPLLQAAEAGGAIILPVIVGHCLFEDTELQQFQPFNNLSEPLAKKKPADRDKVWMDLVRYVITLAKDA